MPEQSLLQLGIASVWPQCILQLSAQRMRIGNINDLRQESSSLQALTVHMPVEDRGHLTPASPATTLPVLCAWTCSRLPYLFVAGLPASGGFYDAIRSYLQGGYWTRPSHAHQRAELGPAGRCVARL